MLLGTIGREGTGMLCYIGGRQQSDTYLPTYLLHTGPTSFSCMIYISDVSLHVEESHSVSLRNIHITQQG